MAIDPDQLRQALIEDLLPAVDGFYSPEAVTLMMITCSAETDMGFSPFRQNGLKEGARGLWQVEPATMFDNYKNHLDFPQNERQRLQIEAACGVLVPNVWDLTYNVSFNCYMARTKFWRVPSPIPKDLKGQAKYYENHFNTTDNYLGPDWAVALAKYKMYCS